VVDDFGVKYVGKEHALHLHKVLEAHYKLTCDWTGQRYISITLNWDYKQRQVHLSMPGYVKKALKQFHPENETSAAFPIPMCTNKIRGHQTICNAGINSTTPQCTGKTFHSTTV
jgi:hypothetical protein